MGAVGLSLGGMTTMLLAFHPELRDPRIQAAVAIAAPVDLFGQRFFEHAATPFLMIAGDIDAVVDYPHNAARLGAWLPEATRVTLHGGSHTGFAGIAAQLFRWLDNPDSVGCWALRGKIDEKLEVPDNFLSELRGDKRTTPAAAERLPCRNPELPTALRPQHQQTLTKFAVLSFFQSQFDPVPRIRDDYLRILQQSLARDFPELDVQSGPPGNLPTNPPGPPSQ